MSRMSRSSRQAGRALFRSSASSHAGSLTDSRTGAIKALHAAYLAAGCPRNPGGVGWNPFLPDLLRVFRTGNGWMFQGVEFKWRATAPTETDQRTGDTIQASIYAYFINFLVAPFLPKLSHGKTPGDCAPSSGRNLGVTTAATLHAVRTTPAGFNTLPSVSPVLRIIWGFKPSPYNPLHTRKVIFFGVPNAVCEDTRWSKQILPPGVNDHTVPPDFIAIPPPRDPAKEQGLEERYELGKRLPYTPVQRSRHQRVNLRRLGYTPVERSRYGTVNVRRAEAIAAF